MPVIQGGVPSWLRGGKVLVTPGKKPPDSSTTNSNDEEKPSEAAEPAAKQTDESQKQAGDAPQAN